MSLPPNDPNTQPAERMLPQSLERLLRSVGPEQEECWAAFVAEFSFLLLHVARGVSASRDERMDLYAHILDELRSRDFYRLKGYVSDPGSKFTTWLTVVARRVCVDRYRARFGRRRPGEDGDQLSERVMRARLEQLVAAPVDPASLPADQASSPDAALRASQIEDVLQHALGALPAADRLLLKLRFEDELPAREIALVLQLPSPFHVYRRINTLLGELRTMLTANGVESAAP